MYEYVIHKEFGHYKITSAGILIFYAIRKNSLFGIDVYFYDASNTLFATSKQNYFLFIDFGHSIKFIQNNYKCKLKGRGKSNILIYENNVYEMKYNLFNRKPELYKNEIIIGNCKTVFNTRDKYELIIACNESKSCWVFSIMDVILDWFDVN